MYRQLFVLPHRRSILIAKRTIPEASSLSRWNRLSYSFASTTSGDAASSNINTTSSSSSASGTNANANHNTRSSVASFVAVAAASLLVGFVAGRTSSSFASTEQQDHVLPSGLPRTCCQEDTKPTPPCSLTQEQQETLKSKLQDICGKEHVLDGQRMSGKTQSYLKGARLGGAPALCIVTPTQLHQMVQIAQTVVDAGAVLLPQGANTGLTGGSVPRAPLRHNDNDQPYRPTVILSTRLLNRIFPLDNGDRVCCLPGVGLAQLQDFLSQHFPHRESHSVLGSTFLNPTAAAGIALGSGGTQCRKGPAYTERALYLKIKPNKWNENVVEIVNTLNIEGMEDDDSPRQRKVLDSVPYVVDTWSRWIHNGYERTMRYTTPHTHAAASDVHYKERLCQHDPRMTHQVSRYNADPSGPEFVRSEGKAILLATVHDTFPKPIRTKSFWISFASLEDALEFRKTVCLETPQDVPIQCEYLNQDSYDVIDRSGRWLGHLIALTGTASPTVASLWKFKLWIEGALQAPLICDQILHTINNVLPSLVPRPIRTMAEQWDHHCSVMVGDFAPDDAIVETFQHRLSQFQKTNPCQVYECASSDTPYLTAFRFVAAPAFRTWCVGNGVQGISVDYALPKNGGQAPPLEDTKSHQTAVPLRRMRYSHFGCNVVHEDLAYAVGVDVEHAKHALKHAVEGRCHGKLPAEHGHGTEYHAPEPIRRKWEQLDPLNVLNPGVGQTSDQYKYGSSSSPPPSAAETIPPNHPPNKGWFRRIL